MQGRFSESSKPRWYQFSLRTLLIWSVVFAMLFGWLRPWTLKTWGYVTAAKTRGVWGYSIRPLFWTGSIDMSFIREPDGKRNVIVYIMDVDYISCDQGWCEVNSK